MPPILSRTAPSMNRASTAFRRLKDDIEKVTSMTATVMTHNILKSLPILRTADHLSVKKEDSKSDRDREYDKEEKNKGKQGGLKCCDRYCNIIFPIKLGRFLSPFFYQSLFFLSHLTHLCSVGPRAGYFAPIDSLLCQVARDIVVLPDFD